MKNEIPIDVPIDKYGEYIMNHFPCDLNDKPEDEWTDEDFERYKPRARRLIFSSCFYTVADKSELTEKEKYVIECVRKDIDIDTNIVIDAFPCLGECIDIWNSWDEELTEGI